MKITINNNTVNLLSKAKQSYNYILNNYFKFLFQKYFLNLVKTFLTSITFDSLSERNLCLVIKKFNYKEFNMNNTKTIFKSLLIMIVAISLFTVSCSKDEGGTKTPTNPTIQKVSADMITQTLKDLGQLKGTDIAQTVILDLSNINPTGGNADINGANQSFNKVKIALERVTQAQWPGVTVTTDLADKNKPDSQNPLSVKITFAANSGFEFDTTITGGTAYTYDTKAKTATLTLNIKPSGNWEA